MSNVKLRGAMAVDATASWIALAAVVYIVFTALVRGVDWVAAHWLPYLYTACWAALAMILVSLPLAASRRLREYTGTGIVLTSYLFGVTAWLASCSLTGALWGGWAVTIGLALFGVTVIPFALLATGLQGMWLDLLLVIGLLAAMLAASLGGGAIARSQPH